MHLLTVLNINKSYNAFLYFDIKMKLNIIIEKIYIQINYCGKVRWHKFNKIKGKGVKYFKK